MPTYVITDDTNSLCLAITGGETKNIDKDNAVVRVIPAGTGLNTTAIDQLSIEHDGDYATRMPWNDVTVSGVSPSSVSDFRTKVMTILNNNSSGGGSTAPITVDLADAGVMLAGVPAFPVEGQVYLINGLGITGVDNIRTVGILDVNTSDYVFNNNCEAYVTALGVYVPCTYDVATNTLYCATKIRLFLTKSPDVGNPVTATIIESNYANSDLAFSVAYAGSETDWDLLITCTSATTLFSENDGNAILGMVFIDKNGEVATFGGLIVGNNAIQATGWSITNSVILATERVSNSVIEIIKIIQ